MKNIKTVELVRELLRRAEHVDAVLDLVESRVATREVSPSVPRRTRGNQRCDRMMFLDAARGAGGPRGCKQLAALTRITLNAANAHARRLCADGKMRVVPGTLPILYEVVQ